MKFQIVIRAIAHVDRMGCANWYSCASFLQTWTDFCSTCFFNFSMSSARFFINWFLINNIYMDYTKA